MARRFVISAVLLMVALGAQARTRPHYGGTLRIEIQGDPWQMPDGLARRLVLDTLTTVSETGIAQPALAVRWTAQNADHRWEFALRSNVHFQDGTPLTGESVVLALHDVCMHSAAAPAIACPWRTVRAVGDSIIFVSDAAVPDLPALLAQEAFAIARQDASGAVIGTGPFRVTGFANGALVLAANDDCWAGRPFVDSVEIHAHRTVRDQWLDFSVGKADIVEVPPEMIRQAQQQHLNVLVSRPVDLLALTVAPNGSFAGREMRQAVALAVDRTALSNVIFQKQGEVTASLLPEALSGFSFLFPTERNLDRARALRGGASPPGLILSTPDASATMHLAAERLALNLHEAGFAVQVAGTGLPAALTLRRLHLEAASPAAALDEMLAHFGQNGTVTATDPASLWQTERGVLDDETIVPLLWLPRAWAWGERVRDLGLSPDGAPLLADTSLEGAK
ncbi:MAG TPA: ABC transporter substrate-binding protein [Acidobacteriaceae bacterium]|jgi:ABC-type transport system substrate-binding protein|nr:ABC transporter substrate-binding protein [Acidobacteriaceae bacterium]